MWGTRWEEEGSSPTTVFFHSGAMPALKAKVSMPASQGLKWGNDFTLLCFLMDCLVVLLHSLSACFDTPVLLASWK